MYPAIRRIHSLFSFSTAFSQHPHYIGSDFLSFALDRHGSRLIQRHLSNCDQSTLSLIIQDAIPHLLTLSVDVFGNYIVQQMITNSTTMPPGILESLKNNLIPLCVDQHGCRVIQASFCHRTALDVIATELLNSGRLGEMTIHVYGNHIVQRIVQLTGPNNNGLGQLMEASMYHLSKDQFGCRFVQRMIEVGWVSPTSWDVKSLINEKYGHYIIQHLLKHSSSVEKNKVRRSGEWRAE